MLMLSVLQIHFVADERKLRTVFDDDQIPAECGGSTTHDQIEWVEFYKVQYSLIITVRWKSVHFSKYMHRSKLSGCNETFVRFPLKDIRCTISY